MYQRRFGWFSTGMEAAFYWMLASVLFWVGLVPVVTIPLGAALAIRLLARQRDRGSEPLPSWRVELARLWRPAFGAGTVMVLTLLVLYGDLWAIRHVDAPALRYMSIPLIPVAVAVLMLQVAFWGTLAVDPGPSRQMLARAVRVALAYPVRCMVGALLGLVAYVALSVLPGMFLMLGPGVVAAIWLRILHGRMDLSPTEGTVEKPGTR